MKRIILASNSPRRQELLRGLDVDFTIDTGNTFEESMDEDVSPRDIPVLMARGKSDGFHRTLEDDEVLITADTVVIVGSNSAANNECPCAVLGKPHSRDEAVAMLKELSGRTHEVITAVVIRSNGKRTEFTDSTLVTFETLTDEEINYYIDKYKPFDKAGSYGVQEWIGYVAISRLEGSFYNVMGFPVHKVYKELHKFI